MEYHLEKMKGFNLYRVVFGVISVLFLTVQAGYAQQLNISGDTAKISFPKTNSPFGLLEVPSELRGAEMKNEFRTFSKFQLFGKEHMEELKRFGLVRQPINLHMTYYNPQKDFHPALYALLLVGAFFNNRVMSIPEEQYRKIMADIYDYPTSSSSRYKGSQFNIQKGVFGRPDITVSGYKTFVPETPKQHTNIIVPDGR